MVMAALAVGHVARLAVRAEDELRLAAEREAAIRERERLARGIHDSVLQVLALVQRRGSELGGEAADLGRLAGEQEAALRALVGPGPATPVPAGMVDLTAELGRFAAPLVALSAPATGVWLPARTAHEFSSAVAAAVENVRRHCPDGAHAGILVEDEPSAVTVTVRDDGPGIPDGRLERAAAEGRLGVAQSIVGRLRELGGSACVTSAPGEGTEIEMRLPRR
jgi:signal transduction histidine kinase